MEVYEKINLYLKEKKISKKEFTKRLLQLNVKLKNTGELPSENTIYAYLNGRIGIRIELIPYIAEVLQIPEQMLFDDSERARKRCLQYILQELTNQERELLQNRICSDTKTKQPPKDIHHEIQDMLIYAPDPFLQKLKRTLQDYKQLTEKFR